MLVVQGGPESGQVHPLLGRTNTIGRDSANGIIIDDIGVSRVHAEIVETDFKHYLHDVSTNGTYVNGNRLGDQEYQLKDGDRINLGPSEIGCVFRSRAAQTLEIPRSELELPDPSKGDRPVQQQGPPLEKIDRPQPPESEPPPSCPHCGRTLYHYHSVCPHCGTALSPGS